MAVERLMAAVVPRTIGSRASGYRSCVEAAAEAHSAG
jgi:hypothetical protein